MKTFGAFASVLVLTGLIAAPANAGPITVLDPSFETPPSGGFPYTIGCHGVPGCEFAEAPISGWVNTGASGQWRPGAVPNAYLFNSLPAGPTVAFTNGPDITQTVSATGIAGDTYTLTVEVGYRKDLASDPFVKLEVGSDSAFAAPAIIPVDQSGDWYLYTATYTATAADAGKPITIVLG